MESSFNLATIDNIPSMVVREEMCNPLTGGGLLPNIVKCCGGPLLDFIVSLFGTVWRSTHRMV